MFRHVGAHKLQVVGLPKQVSRAEVARQLLIAGVKSLPDKTPRRKNNNNRHDEDVWIVWSDTAHCATFSVGSLCIVVTVHQEEEIVPATQYRET